MESHAIGRLGELLTSIILRLRLHRIVVRNFRARRGELDVVSLHRRTLHIVEVKTRVRRFRTRKMLRARPGEAVTWEKRRRILRATAALQRTHHRLPYERVSFDVVEVVFGPLVPWPRFRFLWDAFRADEVPRWRS